MEKNTYLSDEVIVLWEDFSLSLKTVKAKNDYFTIIHDITNFTKKDFLELTPFDAVHFFDQLKIEYQKGNQTKKTINQKLNKLRSFSNFLMNSPKLNSYENPFYLVDPINDSSYIDPQTIPSIEEMDHILSICRQDITLFTTISMILRCAFTVGEICSMQWKDLLEDANHNYGIKIKKHNKERIVKIPEDIMMLIQQYMNIRKQQSEWLFTNKRGNQLKIRDLERLYQKYFPVNQFKYPYKLQDIRNASITYMMKSGAPQNKIADYIGISPNWLFRCKKAVAELELAAVDFVNIKIV